MVVKTFGCVLSGIDGQAVEVEAVRFNARPEIQITGLPGSAVKESRERIRACLRTLGIDTPSARLVVHLLPATQRKEGSQLDLAIAVAILAIEGVIPPPSIQHCGFLGELRLSGHLVRVGRGLSMMQALHDCTTLQRIFVPEQNAWEAGLLASPKVETVNSLESVMARLVGREPKSKKMLQPPPRRERESAPLLDYIHGQGAAKRALQVALAGRHHILFMGTPGVGKSLLSQTAPSLLPELRTDELVQITMIHGERREEDSRPYRSPHHSISSAALLGGGSGELRPGEVTLAHRGVLFLDEFSEFRRDALEGLREPLQERVVRLNRIGCTMKYPADFVLIAAMNPCPCGYLLSPDRPCHCPPDRVLSYRRRLSGPILDRLDIFVTLAGIDKREGIGHDMAKKTIERVWELQRTRPVLPAGSRLLSKPLQSWFESLCKSESLSYRAQNKLARLARTIADLDERPEILQEDILEAWGMRCDTNFHAAIS